MLKPKAWPHQAFAVEQNRRAVSDPAYGVNLLDRYIFKSVLYTCVTAIALFTLVVALPNAIRDLLGPWLAGQLDTPAFLRLMGLLLPFAAAFALPMGMLTGVLLTLGRLSADSEITAMRASGIGVVRLARPVFILAALGTALALYMNMETMPRARVQFHRELTAAIRADPLRLIVPKTFIRDFRGYVIYIGEKDGPVYRDIWLWELDEQRRVRRVIRAESGRLDYDEATNSLIPTLMHTKVEERSSANSEDFSHSPRVASFEKAEQVRISLDRLFSANPVEVKTKWFTYDQLRTEQARLRATPAATPAEAETRAREIMAVELIVQEKFNFSLAVFVFALLGVPMGIKVSRRETSANLGIALALVLGFYFLTVMVKWLEEKPELRPDLLFWVPNVLFIGLGLWLLLRIERR